MAALLLTCRTPEHDFGELRHFGAEVSSASVVGSHLTAAPVFAAKSF